MKSNTHRTRLQLARRTCCLVGMILSCAVNAGCTQALAISGDGMRDTLHVTGDVGIRGDDNRLTILAGSDVSKLSIIGDENEVIFEEGAHVSKVEVVGEENEIRVPEGEDVQWSAIGEDNRLRHRKGD